MENKVTCAERIKEGLRLKDIKQADLCRMTGIPKSDMSQYCSGDVVPRQNRTYAIALALNVSEAWLMGFDVPKEREKKESPLTDNQLGGLMSALKEVGALKTDGSLSDRGREVVSNLLRNNADMLKKLIDEEN